MSSAEHQEAARDLAPLREVSMSALDNMLASAQERTVTH